MSNIKDAMSREINPITIAKNQRDTYRKYILDKLDAVKDAVSNLHTETVMSYTNHSYSGDCMGNENDYINFGFDAPKDIREAMIYLECLNMVVNEEIRSEDFELTLSQLENKY